MLCGKGILVIEDFHHQPDLIAVARICILGNSSSYNKLCRESSIEDFQHLCEYLMLWVSVQGACYVELISAIAIALESI